MIKARQVIHKVIGESGCYLLCLEDIGREVGVHGNIIEAFLSLNPSGIIRDDCYLNAPEKVLEWITGSPWSVRKEGAEYEKKEDEFEVQRWAWKESQINREVLHSHFIRMGFDPYGESLTVRNGTLISKRIFRRIA
jgi:hypothetical protein